MVPAGLIAIVAAIHQRSADDVNEPGSSLAAVACLYADAVPADAPPALTFVKVKLEYPDGPAELVAPEAAVLIAATQSVSADPHDGVRDGGLAVVPGTPPEFAVRTSGGVLVSAPVIVRQWAAPTFPVLLVNETVDPSLPSATL